MILQSCLLPYRFGMAGGTLTSIMHSVLLCFYLHIYRGPRSPFVFKVFVSDLSVLPMVALSWDLHDCLVSEYSLKRGQKLLFLLKPQPVSPCPSWVFQVLPQRAIFLFLRKGLYLFKEERVYPKFSSVTGSKGSKVPPVPSKGLNTPSVSNSALTTLQSLTYFLSSLHSCKETWSCSDHCLLSLVLPTHHTTQRTWQVYRPALFTVIIICLSHLEASLV